MGSTLFSRSTVLSGILIRSTQASGTISDITLPEENSGFTVVQARDIIGDNRVKIADTYVPLLTGSKISYAGQPVLALIGMNEESVLSQSRNIRITYKENDEDDEKKPVKYEKVQGEIGEVINRTNIKSVSQTYHFNPIATPSHRILRVTAGLDGDIMHIQAPSQWIYHMRNTVSGITGIPKKRIVIHPTRFYAPHDELLIHPSMLAALAALGSIISGFPVELCDNIPTLSPEITIKRADYYDPEQLKPVATDIETEIDQGAFALFTDELTDQMLAGLTPPWPCEAARYTFTFKPSSKPPAHFFGDLGFSSAIASTEAQSTLLANALDISPDKWRVKVYTGSPFRDEIIRCSDYPKMKTALEKLTESGDFTRKYHSYELQKQKNFHFSPLFSYCRGMGIATGPELSGFSLARSSIPPLSCKLTLNNKGRVEINTSFTHEGENAGLWRKTVQEKLHIKPEYISFTPPTKELVDSGPSALGVKTGKMNEQIARACDLILQQQEQEQEPPLTATVSGFPRNNTLFISKGWISVMLELEIDTVRFLPVVKNVQVGILTGEIYDRESYISRIKQCVISTITENGAQPAGLNRFTLSVKIDTLENRGANPVTQSVTGLTKAALLQALSQALDTPDIELPVTGQQILYAFKRRKR